MLFVWIAAYGLCCNMGRWISVTWLPDSWMTAISSVIYTISLLCYIKKTNNNNILGLSTAMELDNTTLIFILTALLFPIYNVAFGNPVAPNLPELLYMLCVAAVEELLFRGLLVCKLSRQYGPKCIPLSAILFSMMHLVNLTVGIGLEYAVLQVVCAFSAGLCYAAGSLWCRSILPCVIIHFLTNITGSNTTDFIHTNSGSFGILLCITIQVVCGTWLYLKIKEKIKECD